MLISELLQLIEQGEGAKLEFKRDNIRPESLAREIVSFANMNGGHILLGVEDDGTIGGICRENLQAWVMDSVVGRFVHPYIFIDYEEVAIDNKKIVVLSVHMGTAKPYVLKSNDREDIYVRYGDTCQLASREQQARLFQTGGLVSTESFPIHGSTVNELDERRYQEYFVDILGEDAISDWQEFLINRGFLVGEQNLHCSYFAYALFASNPQRRLPQAGIRLLVFPGTDVDYDANLDKVLNVPFVGLKETKTEFVERSLPNSVLSYLQPHITKEGLEGMQRQRHWDYPPEVIRELLVNAFAHRDWTKQNDVHLTVFSDRLEVNSPGALPNGMTIEKVKAGQQTPRNTNIVRILRDYKFLDDRGMGIRRKVIPLMLEHTGREPEFEAAEDYFKVTIWKKRI